MAKYNFSSKKYKLPSEGVDVFNISKIDYDPVKQSIKISFDALESHARITQFFKLGNDVAEKNLGALLRAAYDDNSLEEFDSDTVENAVGRQFEGQIIHREWNGSKFANLKPFSYEPVSEFHSFAVASEAIL